MNYRLTTLEKSPEYRNELSALGEQAWPVFLRHGNVGPWGELFDRFAGFQILLLSGTELAGAGHTVPLYWNNQIDGLPDTIEQILLSAMGCCRQQGPANALAGLAVMVAERYRGNGMSLRILKAMKQLALENDLGVVIVPVRPTFKCHYPLMPFNRYAGWKRTDGSPFDPWLRVHWKMGASILAPAANTLTVQATVGEWENWTGMRFADSGEYIVDGALKPVLIDCANNCGCYEEPHLWMLHRL